MNSMVFSLVGEHPVQAEVTYPSPPSKLHPTSPEKDRDTREGWEMSLKQSEKGEDPLENGLQSHHDQKFLG